MPIAGGLELDDIKILSKPNHSLILWIHYNIQILFKGSYLINERQSAETYAQTTGRDRNGNGQTKGIKGIKRNQKQASDTVRIGY